MAIDAVHVDADRAVLDETMPTLETNDIAVTPATDAAEVIGLVESDGPDCVVTGTDVGDRDVIDFIGEIRNARPDLPIVLYTDDWDVARVSSAVTAGLTDMVFRDHEPNPPLALVSRIQSALDGPRRDRDGNAEGAIEERYRMLVESAPAPIVIYDQSGTLLYANKAAARFTNAASPDDLVGRDATEFVPEDERDWVETRMRRVLEDRETVPQTELAFRTIDGEPLYAIDVSAPIEYHGEPAGQTVLHDITQLKQRERELEENRRRLETLIDNIPGMVYRCSTVESPWPMEFVGGKVEELTGYTAEEIESGEVLWGRDVILEEDLQQAEQAVLEAVEEDEPFELTYRIRTASGDVRHLWEQGEGLREDGEVVALEGVIMDVTAKQEEQRRLETHESYRRNLYRIVHEEELAPMERVEKILKLGTERFGVDIGFLTAIDLDDEIHHVVEAVGEHDLITAGAEAPLDQTYCRNVLQEQDIVGVNDAVGEGWEDDPAYIEYGFGCYIGGQVHVHGELYGTICFADEDPREESFGHNDRMFVELLARAVGHELDLMQEPTDAE